MAKEFLSQNHIHFTAKDINQDQTARAEMMKLGSTGVPTFLIGDEVVIGLDKDRILQLVDHRLQTCEKCGTAMRVPIDKGRITATCPKCGHSFEVDPDKAKQ